MKKGGGGGGGDTLLEGRHLVGLFLGVVVLCGVFFTLGYVMGRTQYDTSVRAATAKESAPAPVAPAAGQTAAKNPTTAYRPSDWGFYSSGEAKKTEDRLTPPPESKPATVETAAKPKTSEPAAPRPSLKAPSIPRGSVVLQVAALAREHDALALAEALQKKQFPAFVLTPTSDNLYRVQVGPFADQESATLAKRALEREGFKAITKR